MAGTAPNAVTIILTRNGVADPGQDATVAALKQRLQAPDAKLLLHLHGGLVTEANGKAAAERLSGAGDNSWNLGPDWTQLYVVWRTGAFETLATNWTDLAHNDRLYQAILRKLIGYVAKRLGVPAPGGARSSVETMFNLDDSEIQRRITGQGDRRDPFGDIDVYLDPQLPPGARASVMVPMNDARLAMDFQNELAGDLQFQRAVADIDEIANEGVPGRLLSPQTDPVRARASYDRLSREVKAEIDQSAPTVAGARGLVSAGVMILKHAATIAYRVFKRFRSHRDHGFQATIVEELCRELYGDLIGGTIWGMIVQDAADHFADGGFGAALLDLLDDVPAPTHFAVSAHSAGSIWALRMLQAMTTRQQAAQVRLVLLAPAVRQDLFAQAIAQAGDRIASCHMLTMTDALERKDAVLGHDKGYIYPSSLLYCVSGLFEERDADAYVDAPLVGMMRYTGATWLTAQEAADAALIAQFFAQPQNGITAAPTPGVCEADCHGCFDDEKFTLKTAAGLF